MDVYMLHISPIGQFVTWKTALYFTRINSPQSVNVQIDIQKEKKRRKRNQSTDILCRDGRGLFVEREFANQGSDLPLLIASKMEDFILPARWRA
jgi:hypothetical protein